MLFSDGNGIWLMVIRLIFPHKKGISLNSNWHSRFAVFHCCLSRTQTWHQCCSTHLHHIILIKKEWYEMYTLPWDWHFHLDTTHHALWTDITPFIIIVLSYAVYRSCSTAALTYPIINLVSLIHSPPFHLSIPQLQLLGQFIFHMEASHMWDTGVH